MACVAIGKIVIESIHSLTVLSPKPTSARRTQHDDFFRVVRGAGLWLDYHPAFAFSCSIFHRTTSGRIIADHSNFAFSRFCSILD